MSRRSDLANLSGVDALQSPLHATQTTPGEVDRGKSARRFGSCETDSGRLLQIPRQYETEISLLEETLDVSAGVALVRADGTIVHTNDVLQRMYGYPREELIGRRACEVFANVPPKGAPEQRETTNDSCCTLRQRRKNGTEFLVHSTVRKTRSLPDAALWILVDQDRLQSECGTDVPCALSRETHPCVLHLPGTRFRQLQDERGTMLEICPGIEKLTGYSAQEFIAGGKTLNGLILPPDGLDGMHTEDQELPNKLFEHDSIRIRHRDGSIRFVEMYRRLIPPRGAQPAFISGLLLDATETKKLEEELLQAHKAEAVGMLAGGIAHDFNTLLTAIFGWLEIAGSELPAEHSARDALRMAEKAARQAVGLTRSLLTISHRAPTEMQRIRLDEVVQESVRLLARLLPASIEQRVELPEETVWIDGDPTQVQQVLMNLAVNARDAMPDGGTLWIKLETCPRSAVPKAAQCESFSGGVAVLSVRDSGCGLSPDVEARALEPFFTTKSRERGTGLGLSIVQAIVTSHGGWIDIDSEVDRGSTFTVHLPRKGPAAMPAEAEPCQLEETAPPACVLVVEDNDLVRAMLATILTDAGHSVREAADGEEAIRLLTEHADEIDLAIVDLDLPKVNGVSVLTTASKLSSRLRGIGITGFPINDATRKRIEDLGYPILNKPFQVHAIKELVAQLLKK